MIPALFCKIKLVKKQSGPGTLQSKREKTETNRKRKMSMTQSADDDEDSKDWWTKYFASVEAMIEVCDPLRPWLYF